MKIGLSIWNGRISPVFDVAGRLAVWDLERQTGMNREEVPIGQDLVEKTRRLSELGIGVLVCGAISQPLALIIERSGIRVMANICGAEDQVAAAFVAGRLGEADFMMPGCCGRRRRFRGCRRKNLEIIDREGNKQ